MAKSSTGNIVLDTSVVVKSILEPPKHLPSRIYRREVETRRKIHVALDLLRKHDYAIYFPRTGLVEVASVLKRNGLDKQDVLGVLKSIEETFIIVDEAMIYNKALEVALTTAPSGFDTYFIAVALTTNSILITDDETMARHAKTLGIDTILIRRTAMETLQKKLGKPMH